MASPQLSLEFANEESFVPTARPHETSQVYLEVQDGKQERFDELFEALKARLDGYHPFSSQGTTLQLVPIFHPFPRLPAEIQDIIWSFAVANLPSESLIIGPYTEDSALCRVDPRHGAWRCPEVDGKRTCRYSLIGQFFDRNSCNALPAYLSVCQASREMCLQLFDFCFATSTSESVGDDYDGQQPYSTNIPPRCRVATQGILFRPSRDTIYLSSANNGLCEILCNKGPHELKTSNIESFAIEDNLFFDDRIRSALLTGTADVPPLLQGMKEFILVVSTDGDIQEDDEELVSREYLHSQVPLWEEAFQRFESLPPNPKIVLMTRNCLPEKNAVLWKYVFSDDRYEDNHYDTRYSDRVLRIHKRLNPGIVAGSEMEQKFSIESLLFFRYEI